uniref:NADH-ubiquinone oxidoreductase chain 5 n=1 Tax=Haemopis sanguisuga TaxID=51991 RepID=A0A7L7S777_9ANNE|nr:NADH dehydrogenase subunit 5 [Haemopis sanguisuga]
MLMLLSLFMFMMSFYIFYKDLLILFDLELYSLNGLSISFPLVLDYKGVLFSFVVLFISSNVMLFSSNYMVMDKNIDRFSILVILFVLSMNMLIFIPHLGFLLLGWDGLGITSFILVIYYLNPKSLGAGMITAITNRIGDVLLLMSIAVCMSQCHWNVMNMWFSNLNDNKIQIIMIMLAGMTKSAQVPFSSWLPAAMAAPTPVSALVHSSTLVTAGVFLMIRFYEYMSKFVYFNELLLIVSIITMIMSGLAASVEWDMKKIIALSTLSQLGLMLMSLSLNMPELTYLHMVSHALFKALLFICAGNLIMNYYHSQDMRWMGNIYKQMPMSSTCILLSSLAMAGFPFLASFYTKDQILELSMYNNWSMTMIVLLYLSIGITVFYSFRFCMNLLWLISMTSSMVTLNEGVKTITSLLMMSITTIMMSSLLLWLYPNKVEIVCMDSYMFLLPLLIIFIGIFLGLMWSLKSLEVSFSIQVMNNTMWFLVPLSSQIIMNYSMSHFKYCLETVDQSWLEYYGGYGLFFMLNFWFKLLLNFMNWTLMSMLFNMMLIFMLIMNYMLILN